MADAFYGEIRAFPYTFSPIGWELCDGRLMSIMQNQALFSLLGIKFGGDGKSTFGLPNLQGLVVTNVGTSATGTPYQFGEVVGATSVQLNPSSVPQHNHSLNARVSSSGGTGMTSVAQPSAGSMLSRTLTSGNLAFNGFDKPPITSGKEASLGMNVATFGGATGGAAAAHANMMPYLTLRYFICTEGFYPYFP